MTKCQTLRKFWHLELFWRDLFTCNLTLSHYLGMTSKKTTLYMSTQSQLLEDGLFFIQFCCRFSFPAKTTFFANLSFYTNNPDNFNKWVHLLFEIWKHLSRIHQFVLGLTNSTQIDSYLLRAGAISYSPCVEIFQYIIQSNHFPLMSTQPSRNHK